MKRQFLFACFLLLTFNAFSQKRKIYSKLPCNAEVWQVSLDYVDSDGWEEILVCDLNPKDPSTWTWYYNFKSNKKGILKLEVLNFWQDEKGAQALVKIPNNPNKYKISQITGTKDLKMEKVEGNMDLPYYKEFEKIQ